MILAIAGLLGAAALLIAQPLLLALRKCLPKFSLGRRTAQQFVPPGWEAVKIARSDGHLLSALYLDRGASASVVCVHGGGGMASAASKFDMIPYGEILHSLGFNVLTIDCFGFGDSDGYLAPQGYADGTDVTASVEWLSERRPSSAIGILGFSRGAVIAVRALEHLGDTVKFLVLEGIGNEQWKDVLLPASSHSPIKMIQRYLTFVFIAAIGSLGFKRPLRRLEDILAGISIPVLFVAADNEPEERSRVLWFHDRYAGPKQYVGVPCNLHGSIITQHPQRLHKALSDFGECYLGEFITMPATNEA